MTWDPYQTCIFCILSSGKPLNCLRNFLMAAWTQRKLLKCSNMWMLWAVISNVARFTCYLVHVFWFDLAKVTCYMVYDLLHIYILNLLLRNHWTHGWCMVLMTRLYGDKKADRKTVFFILCCMAQLQSICSWMKNLFLRECKMPWRGYYTLDC